MSFKENNWIKIPKKYVTFGDLYKKLVNTKDPVAKKELEEKIKIRIDELFYKSSK